jgi:glutamate-1-semialdehyde aminotransferase
VERALDGGVHLGALREEIGRTGALPILVEVMASRFGPHGAGALHGIVPDLMTWGK